MSGVVAFGDRALRFAISPATHGRALFAALAGLARVVDVVLTEEVGCVYFGSDTTDADRDATLRVLESAHSGGDAKATRHRIEVVYDGDDLDEIARTIGRSRADVIALHAGAEYRVAMLGFLPGFGYLTGLPPELRLPRRSPRPRVPAGSVGIAADYTGIYPFASPGGWHLVGRAPSFVPFDTAQAEATLAIGDAVTFEAIPSGEIPEPPAPAAPAAVEGPHLEVVRAQGVALLVDGGRPGLMHAGVPPGGPLVASALARANAFVGNAPDACAVEVLGTFEVVARGGAMAIADDEHGLVRLAEDEHRVVSTDRRTRVRYLAVAGGVEAPVVLGSSCALLVAGIGAPLRRGTTIAPRSASASMATAPPPSRKPDLEGPIAIMPGPDADERLLDAIARTPFVVSSTSDRTGTRLEGALTPAEHAMTRRSTPMTLGAIELTPSGLIVLGPDHPTTGGYPVVAVLRSAAQDAFTSLPFGATVRFRVA